VKYGFSRSTDRGQHLASGFTIVELMVAMVLALLITAAVGALYVTSRQTFRVQDNSSGIDETMRALEEDISREIRKAGYFACFRWKDGVARGAGNAFAITARTPLSVGGGHPIPMEGSPAVVKLGIDHDVRGGAASSTTVNPLPTTVTIVPGSEFLSVSYGQPQAYLTTQMTSGVETLQLNRSIPVKNGQPLLLTNCDAMVLMRADQDGPRSDIAHDPASSLDNTLLGDTVWAYTLFGQGSTLMSLQSSVFFLGQKAGDPPTLYLLSPDNPLSSAEPLAANVEQLNFLYGVDTGAASLSFMNAAAVTAAAGWSTVRAVRVGFVMRSSDDSVSGTAAGVGINFIWNAANGRYDSNNTATDSRLRKAHVFTVAIRGRSPSI
jgi:type IV pilus assembly protein PilW